MREYQIIDTFILCEKGCHLRFILFVKDDKTAEGRESGTTFLSLAARIEGLQYILM